MNILVVGGGGREHALIWKIAQSEQVDKIYCAPGNPGIAELAEVVPIAVDDIDALYEFALSKQISLTVVGPELPLTLGIADKFHAGGLDVFGPSKAAAQLEGSKGFSKDIMQKYSIPTAAYASFTQRDAAVEYIREQGAPIVVKADGLAAGKGVILAQTEAEAIEAIDEILVQGKFGAAGEAVVIEEFLYGEEASFFVLCDGQAALPIGTAQDHKRASEGDTGPNTGGMGAYSPAPVMTPEVTDKALAEIVRPVLAEMARRGTPYQGVLFVGLMIRDGQPRLVEFNVRFGDPECQALMMRLGGQILDLMQAAAEGRLADISVNWADDHALTVVMAAAGYPGPYDKGSVIGGILRNGSTEIATGNSQIRPNDRVIIFCLPQAVEKMTNLFK